MLFSPIRFYPLPVPPTNPHPRIIKPHLPKHQINSHGSPPHRSGTAQRRLSAVGSEKYRFACWLQPMVRWQKLKRHMA